MTLLFLLFVLAVLLTPYGIAFAAVGFILMMGERRRSSLKPWSEAMFFIAGVLCLPVGILILMG